MCNVIHDNRHNKQTHEYLEGILNFVDAAHDYFELEKENDALINRMNKASLPPPEKKKNANTWDFVEKYYPNYSSCDKIGQANGLYAEIFDNNNTSEELAIEYDMLMKNIYEQTIKNFIKINGGI